MKYYVRLVLCIGGLVVATPMWAHHSFEAEYDRTKDVTMTGTVTESANDFPVQNAYQNVSGGNHDAFVAKIGVVEDDVFITDIEPDPYSTDICFNRCFPGL